MHFTKLLFVTVIVSPIFTFKNYIDYIDYIDNLDE